MYKLYVRMELLDWPEVVVDAQPVRSTHYIKSIAQSHQRMAD